MKLRSLGIDDLCPFGEHEGGPWDVAFTGAPEGVSCVKCHRTWLKRSYIDPGTMVVDYYVPTYVANGWKR